MVNNKTELNTGTRSRLLQSIIAQSQNENTASYVGIRESAGCELTQSMTQKCDGNFEI